MASQGSMVTPSEGLIVSVLVSSEQVATLALSAEAWDGGTWGSLVDWPVFDLGKLELPWVLEGSIADVGFLPPCSGACTDVTSRHLVSNCSRVWVSWSGVKVSLSGSLSWKGFLGPNFDRPFHSFIFPTSEVALVVVKSSSKMTWYCGLTWSVAGLRTHDTFDVWSLDGP